MDRIVSDFSKVKVGDRVFDLTAGEAEVIDVGDTYFRVRQVNGSMNYTRTLEGRVPDGIHTVCFWFRPEFIVPPPPKRKVKKERVKWYNVYANCEFAYNTEEAARKNFADNPLAVAVRVVVPYEEEE